MLWEDGEVAAPSKRENRGEKAGREERKKKCAWKGWRRPQGRGLKSEVQ